MTPDSTGSAGPPPAHTTVFLALADDALRTRVATIVEGAPDLDLAGQTAGGGDAITQICSLVPDLAIVDIDLDDPDGLAVCATISERFPVVRLLLVSDADDERCYGGVVAGAVGCLLTNELGDQILPTLRRVSWGEGVVTKGWATRMLAEVAALTAEAGAPGDGPSIPVPELTPTEREVLRRIAGGASPASVGELHQVPTRLVNLHAGFAVGKLRRVHRDQREAASLQ